MDRVTILVANGVDSESEQELSNRRWKVGLNSSKIRAAFEKVGLRNLTIPANKEPKNVSDRSRLPIGLDFDDVRDLLRSGKVIPFPHGGCRAVMNYPYESFFIRIQANYSSAQFSFHDALSLLDLIPYSSRAIWANQLSPTVWNVYFVNASAVMRFLNSQPPFLTDFPALTVDVRYDLTIFSQSFMKASWVMGVFPVVYRYTWVEMASWKSHDTVKAMIWAKFGDKLHHLAQYYPRNDSRSGILFFRLPKDAVDFSKGEFREGRLRLYPTDCRLNNCYKHFKGF